MITVDWENYTLRVFSSMYLDYGLEITREGEELFYNPHCLSFKSYGFHHSHDDDIDGEAWTAADWKQRITWEAPELVDGFVPMLEQEG